MLQHVYILHHPDEGARGLPAPAYDRQKELGAQFGCVNGWELQTITVRWMPRTALITMRAVSAVAVGGNTPRTRPRRFVRCWFD